MNVGMHANMVDRKTSEIGDELRAVFDILCSKLNGEYGGIIEHLWIDFELIESRAKPNGKSMFPFRFAKRVSGRSRLGLPPTPDYYHVGHFSVRPDFSRLLSLPKDKKITYCLNLIYNELAMLSSKEKKLGGFDSALFRRSFRDECERMGYIIHSH